MNLPFDAWFILVGLIIGAGLAWLVLADMRRRDDDISMTEMHGEAAWIADALQAQEIAADADAVEEVLRLHRTYLAGIPDDDAWTPAMPAVAAAPDPGAPMAAPDPSRAPLDANPEWDEPHEAPPADDEAP